MCDKLAYFQHLMSCFNLLLASQKNLRKILQCHSLTDLLQNHCTVCHKLHSLTFYWSIVAARKILTTIVCSCHMPHATTIASPSPVPSHWDAFLYSEATQWEGTGVREAMVVACIWRRHIILLQWTNCGKCQSSMEREEVMGSGYTEACWC